ncbi:MAG: hypothetical protein AABX37_00190 [Nanoarchaeota archaeon]
MLVFGIDIPLVEILLVLVLVIFVLLAESVIVVILLIKQMNKSKKLIDLVERMSETILSIKKAEIEQLDRIRGRK